MLNKNFAVIQHRKLTCVATVIIEMFTMLRKVLYYDNMKQVRKNAQHSPGEPFWLLVHKHLHISMTLRVIQWHLVKDMIQ